MMKLKHFALSMACVLAVVLTGCSANRVNTSADPVESSTGALPDHDAQNSAGTGSNAQNSADIGAHNSGSINNDAAEGGGAGGTNDRDNDGIPNGSAGDVVDDIGDAAGDLARGVGDVVHDAGDAINHAATGVKHARH